MLKNNISVREISILCLALGNPRQERSSPSLSSTEASERSAHSGGRFPKGEQNRPPPSADPGPSGKGPTSEKVGAAGARVQQNLWQEVRRRRSLPPAPPTGGAPKHPGFDNVLGGAGPGAPESTRESREPATAPHTVPSPRDRGLGGPCPRRPSGSPEGKRQLRGSWGRRRAQPRAKRGPPGVPPATRSGVARPGPGATASPHWPPRSALGVVGPAPRPLLFTAQSLRRPRERSPTPLVSALPGPDRPSLRGAPGNAPSGPGTPTPGAPPTSTRVP